MKVLQLIDTLDAGGSERMALNIANALVDEGVTSHLCATRRGGPLQNDLDGAVSFFLLKKKGKLDMQAFRRFLKWVKKEQIEIIHAHSTSIFLAVLAKINNKKLKIVWHDHYGMSQVIEKRPSRVLKVFSKYIDQTIAVNQILANWSKNTLRVEEVVFLKNFASLSKKSLRETILQGIEGKRVICIANLRPQKNHLELIKAFSGSIENFPEWTLHLVGKSFKDDYSKAIEGCIVDQNLHDNVFLYGNRNDIKYILNQATIGVLASISEGLPVSLLEYANNALPVIVTDVGQCAEVVGNNGIVIKDVEKELPQALIRLYEDKENQRISMGLRLRESVCTTYSKEAFMQKLIPIYKALIP